MTNRSNVHRGLARNDFRVQGCDFCYIKVSQGLLLEVVLLIDSFLLTRDNFLLGGSLEVELWLFLIYHFY